MRVNLARLPLLSSRKKAPGWSAGRTKLHTFVFLRWHYPTGSRVKDNCLTLSLAAPLTMNKLIIR
jgi:hypothetical protein